MVSSRKTIETGGFRNTTKKGALDELLDNSFHVRPLIFSFSLRSSAITEPKNVVSVFSLHMMHGSGLDLAAVEMRKRTWSSTSLVHLIDQ